MSDNLEVRFIIYFIQAARHQYNNNNSNRYIKLYYVIKNVQAQNASLQLDLYYVNCKQIFQTRFLSTKKIDV